MSRFFSLVRASFSQDMQIFNYRIRANSSRLNKILLPAAVTVVVMFSVATLAIGLVQPLHEVGQGPLALALALVLVSLLALIEGIYKSQSILFDAKDNDLLFSLPIPKSQVFALRVLKLVTFQFVYNLFFLVPVFGVYIFFETPDFGFYPLSLLMMVLVPLVPTSLGVLIGYLIRNVSIHFKFQKLAQVILSFVFMGVVMYGAMKVQDLLAVLIQQADSLSSMLSKFYYPIGAYSELLARFDFRTFLGLLAVNIVPFILVILFCSHNYLKIVSKSKTASIQHGKVTARDTKVSSQTIALVKKEFSRYFSSPVYIMNTFVGLLIFLIFAFSLCFKGNELLGNLSAIEDLGISLEQIYSVLPLLIIQVIIFTCCTTSITSPNISLEGGNINILKALPLSVETILRAKILFSMALTVPVLLVGILVLAIVFPVGIVGTLFAVGYSFVAAAFSAMLGLFFNLKYPKMDATSDTEAVKQSASVMFSTMSGMIVTLASVAISVIFLENPLVYIVFEFIFFVLVDLGLWTWLKHGGKKRFLALSA